MLASTSEAWLRPYTTCPTKRHVSGREDENLAARSVQVPEPCASALPDVGPCMFCECRALAEHGQQSGLGRRVEGKPAPKLLLIGGLSP